MLLFWWDCSADFITGNLSSHLEPVLVYVKTVEALLARSDWLLKLGIASAIHLRAFAYENCYR